MFICFIKRIFLPTSTSHKLAAFSLAALLRYKLMRQVQNQIDEKTYLLLYKY